MAAAQSRCGLDVQQTSVQQLTHLICPSRSSLVSKPIYCFCCHRIIIQHIQLGHHSMREKELSNILIAPKFNQLQWMSRSSSCCIDLEQIIVRRSSAVKLMRRHHESVDDTDDGTISTAWPSLNLSGMYPSLSAPTTHGCPSATKHMSPMYTTDVTATNTLHVVSAARAWNALASSVRSAPSLLQFRRDLQTALHVSVIVLFTIVSCCVTDCNR